MVRKRPFPRHRDGLTDSPLYSTGVRKLARSQEEGRESYGDAVLEKEHRLGRESLFKVGAPEARGAAQIARTDTGERLRALEVTRHVTYVPPARVIPNNGEISDVLNEMTRDLVIPEEEFKLVEEARQLGWSWQKIANELQGRTPKQLMKIYSDVGGDFCEGRT